MLSPTPSLYERARTHARTPNYRTHVQGQVSSSRLHPKSEKNIQKNLKDESAFITNPGLTFGRAGENTTGVVLVRDGRRPA